MDTLTFLLLCLVQCLVAWPMVLGFFMSGCSCCGPCDLLSDDFTSSGTSNFDIISGTWSVSSFALQTSSTNAVALAKTTTGTAIEFTTTGSVQASVGTGGRVIFGWVDSSNYHYAQSNGGNSSPTVVKVSSGVSTTLTPIRTGGRVERVCWSEEQIIVGSEAIGYSVYPNADVQPGRVGFGTNASGSTIAFDNLVVTTPVRTNSINATCPCCPVCDTICPDGMPETIEVTFGSASVKSTFCSCADVNGNTYVLSKVAAPITYLSCDSSAVLDCVYRATLTAFTCTSTCTTQSVDLIVALTRYLPAGSLPVQNPGCNGSESVYVALGTKAGSCWGELVWIGATAGETTNCAGQEIECSAEGGNAAGTWSGGCSGISTAPCSHDSYGSSGSVTVSL